MDLIDFFNQVNVEVFDGKWKVYWRSENMSIKCSTEKEFFEMVGKTNEIFKKYLYYNIKVMIDLEKLRISIMRKKDLNELI